MGASKVGWLGEARGETGAAGRGAQAVSAPNARMLTTHVTTSDLRCFNLTSLLARTR